MVFFSPMGVSVYLLLQTHCCWISFCAFFFPKNISDCILKSSLCTRNHETNCNSSVDEGVEKYLNDWKAGGMGWRHKSGSVMKGRELKFDRQHHQGHRRHQSHYGHQEKSTKNESCGFLLAPRGPGHTRVASTSQNNTAKLHSQETSEK